MTAMMGTSTSVTLATLRTPPKETTAVTTMRAAKEIQYRAELVAISVPVRMLAMEPTGGDGVKALGGEAEQGVYDVQDGQSHAGPDGPLQQAASVEGQARRCTRLPSSP